MSIQILTEQTINKIAAGEVVERPANVVKELVENAIDAGSRQIAVELRDAGRSLIRVRDDGAGMTPEELQLAVTRHATSKITAFEDLDRLGTLGFRGEALPSIAAVAHVRLQSQKHDASAGGELVIAGGTVIEDRAWAGAAGTVVEVSRLFFNTPAREKFLKSEATERSRAVAIVEELALAWPEIAFSLTVDGRQVLDAPPTAHPEERLRDVLGKDVAEALIPVSAAHPRVRIAAYVTRREKHLATRTAQFLFINRRPVNLNRSVLHSLYDAYRELLPQGRHPGAVIFLQVDPAQVDVNIHPTKREVKFAHEQELHDLMLRAVKEAVLSAAVPSLLTAQPQPVGSVPAPYAAGPASGAGAAPRDCGVTAAGIAEMRALYQPAAAAECMNPAEAPEEFTVYGQAFNLYIIAEHNNKLLIVDQHAAAERVRYEEYLAEWEQRSIPVQQLLIPLTVELPPSQAGLLRAHLPAIQEAGWQIEEFGACTVRISAVPAVLGTHAQVRDILEEVVAALMLETRLPQPEKVERIIRAACRGSIKAGDHVSRSEISRLLRDLFACDVPFTCPHGRPTVFTLSNAELAKYFGRS